MPEKFDWDNVRGSVQGPESPSESEAEEQEALEEKIKVTLEAMKASLEESSPVVKLMKIFQAADDETRYAMLFKQRPRVAGQLNTPDVMEQILHHPEAVLYQSLGQFKYKTEAEIENDKAEVAEQMERVRAGQIARGEVDPEESAD